ncbi:MAG: branched-chain amino acid ABC transporter substrate-binding protein [Casimicrobiaceae bacterium]|nr:branched-chain amino acid ABC transporter substrate-binding protein [Pseudomonadota bacterium]
MRRFLTNVFALLLSGVAATFAITAYAKESVKIVFIGPLTGGNSALGLGGRNSADLAVHLRNADPKAKYGYELLKLDDQCKPDIGVQVATKAGADNSIIAGVTHYCSAVAIATVDTYHKFGLPVIVWGAVLPAITYGNDFPEIHRVNGTMINQNEVNAKLVTGLGYKTWVIIHDTTDYGKGHDEYFTKFLTQDGGKVLADFGVGADQQDFTAILTKVKELNPQVVYFGGLTPIGVRIRSQMDKLGIKAQFEGTSGIVSDSYIQALGPLAEGTIAFIDGAPIDKLPGGKLFLEQYAAQKYGEPPEAYGAYAFVAANLIMDTIEKVGPNRKDVTDALGKTRDHPSIVGPITFDAHGQNIVPIVTAYVAQDGKWVVWQESDYAKGTRKLAGGK